MTMRPVRAPLALAALLAPLVLVSCKGREKPAAEVSTPTPPPPAAAATAPPPPTTMPTPPPVWREARWGMTKEEVVAAFPGEAQRLPQAASFAQPQPGSSLAAGASDVGIPVLEAHGARFRVLFGFESDALNRVQLAALKAGPATCDDLRKALTDEHSAPVQRGSIGTSLRGEEMVWRRPDRTITLACTGVASLGFQTVTLDYAAPVVREAGAN